MYAYILYLETIYNFQKYFVLKTYFSRFLAINKNSSIKRFKGINLLNFN